MSTKSTQLTDIHFKVDAAVKADAEATLQELGLSMSNYLNMALRQLNLQREIPFRATTKREKLTLPGDNINTKEELDAFLMERHNNFDKEPSYSQEDAKAELEKRVGRKIFN